MPQASEGAKAPATDDRSAVANGSSDRDAEGERIAQRVAAALGLSESEARRAVRAVAQAIEAELVQGGEVSLPVLGTMRVVERKLRLVKDLETGEQSLAPAESAVRLMPRGALKEAVESRRLRVPRIVLAVPQNDTFAKVIDFHFSRTGWAVKVVHSYEECMKALDSAPALLVIVDFALAGAPRLIEELQCARRFADVPVIALYPAGLGAEDTPGFHVLADDRLVEPFEVLELLAFAERHLSRAREVRGDVEHDVRLEFATVEEHLERAAEIGQRLFREAVLGEEAEVALGAAFREALGNAAQHGNANDPSRRVRVRLALTRKEIRVTVTDDGPGFDHRAYLAEKAHLDPVTAARERHAQGRPGGLGLILIARCVDEFSFNDAGNELTLKKRRR